MAYEIIEIDPRGIIFTTTRQIAILSYLHIVRSVKVIEEVTLQMQEDPHIWVSYRSLEKRKFNEIQVRKA